MLKLYLKDGWTLLRQKGSHVQVNKDGQTVTIPMHRELKKGTEHDLFKKLKSKGK